MLLILFFSIIALLILLHKILIAIGLTHCSCNELVIAGVPMIRYSEFSKMSYKQHSIIMVVPEEMYE